MNTSRDVLRAALAWWPGAYDQLAKSALARAGVDAYTDPDRIALALGRVAVPVMSLDDRFRAELAAGAIRYGWVVDEPLESDLNLLYGDGLVVLREAGIAHPTEAQAWAMTVAVALPADAPQLWVDHPHLPRWFVEYRIAARRGDHSGILPAIAKA